MLNKPSRNGPKTFDFCQSGKISPNLVKLFRFDRFSIIFGADAQPCDCTHTHFCVKSVSIALRPSIPLSPSVKISRSRRWKKIQFCFCSLRVNCVKCVKAKFYKFELLHSSSAAASCTSFFCVIFIQSVRHQKVPSIVVPTEFTVVVATMTRRKVRVIRVICGTRIDRKVELTIRWINLKKSFIQTKHFVRGGKNRVEKMSDCACIG